MLATAGVLTVMLVRQDDGPAPSSASTTTDTASSTLPTTTAPPAVYASGWNRLPDPPLDPRTFAVTAVVGDEVYVFGGSEYVCRPGDNCPLSGRLFRDGAAFDAVGGTWRALAEAPIDIASASTAVVGGDVYLLSGSPELGADEHLLRYSTSDDVWTQIDDLPEDLGIALVAHGERLVVFPVDQMTAGVDEWLLDPSDGSWTRLPEHGLPDDASRWFAGTPAGLLVVSTDPEHVATIQRLSDDDAEWLTLSTGAARGVRSAVVGSTILFSPYAYDGSEGGIFDADTATWRPVPALPGGLSSATVAVGLITVDGAHQTGQQGQVFDARADSWITMDPVDGREWPAVADYGQDVFVFGGQDWSTVADTGGYSESPLVADAWLWVPPPTS